MKNIYCFVFLFKDKIRIHYGEQHVMKNGVDEVRRDPSFTSYKGPQGTSKQYFQMLLFRDVIPFDRK